MNNDLRAFVTDAYRTLLLRDPDKSGLDHFMSLLRDTPPNYASVLTGIISSAEFYYRRGQIVEHYHPRNRNVFFNEVSQFGEVSELLRAMVKAGCSNNIVVDVGVRGKEGSNSFDLMRWFGWKGLLVEANEDLNVQIRREFGQLDYKIVNIAVSDYEGTAAFHIGSSDGVSSLNQDSVLRFGASGATVEVRVDKLQNVLHREAIPHRFGLLSIDIEGEDLKVINCLLKESEYRPDWLIIEAPLDGDYRPGALGLVDEFDRCYHFAGRTQANLLFRGPLTFEDPT